MRFANSYNGTSELQLERMSVYFNEVIHDTHAAKLARTMNEF